jgi:2-alkenal reductase
MSNIRAWTVADADALKSPQYRLAQTTDEEAPTVGLEHVHGRTVKATVLNRHEDNLLSRFSRVVTVWFLLLATAWIAEPYVVALWSDAAEPRTVTARGNLSEAEQATIKLFETASPSVLHVFARGEEQNSLLDEDQQDVVQSGTGIAWDTAGHVITNYHVISGTNRIGARLTSGEFVNAHVVGVAPTYDLAVLQLDGLRSPLRPIAVGRSADLQVGQQTFAIGNPYGLEETLTSGIISALHRRLPTSASHEISGVIQTDAPINPGNSGGPLLDSAGRLIGVTSAIISGSGASAGIGFAIPIDVVNRVASELIRHGRVPVPGIGIVGASERETTRLDTDGIIIVRTVPQSPAAKAGLEGADINGGAVADVITAVNGKPVHSMSDLANILEDVGIGKTVKLTVTREGRPRSVDVPIADISQQAQG